MIFEALSVGPMDSNCYIIGCEQTKECAIVDPGAEAGRILQRIESLGLNCKYIILTHGHIDHLAALEEVRVATKAQVLIHEDDADALTSPSVNLSLLMGRMTRFKEADRKLKDKDLIEVGNLKMEVIHTPGHTPGGISLTVGSDLLTGDTLFAYGVGRTDFPGGDFNILINSIKNKLLVFPPETRIFPGHGPSSTVGNEAKYNPFL